MQCKDTIQGFHLKIRNQINFTDPEAVFVLLLVGQTNNVQDDRTSIGNKTIPFDDDDLVLNNFGTNFENQ